MRKLLIVLVVLFIVNLGCKKLDEDNGGGLCACSPVTNSAFLSLVVKNSNGADLLDQTIPGAYSKDHIQLYSKDANDVVKQINYVIRPTFNYGQSQKFNYNQILSQEIGFLAKTASNKFYLKFGNAEPLEVILGVEGNKLEKLVIGGKEMPLAISNSTSSEYVNSIYSLTL